MNKKFFFFFILPVLTIFESFSNNPSHPRSLVPETPSKAPDYFCTWSMQGYIVNYSGSENTRAAMNEKNIFGTKKYEGWVRFFPKIRADLFFVMDDSWDIPGNINTNNNEYLGTTEVDTTRFPSFKGTAKERLKKLTERIKSYGWKGAGGWICAQEAAADRLHHLPEAYWKQKLEDADYAGFGYWKVDWGKNDRSRQWRERLTRLGRQYAPHLFIEHAMINEIIESSDLFRTYDVESVISSSTTIQRISRLLNYTAKEPARGIINCEDEPYIAVGLGCAIGIMRYPFDGNLPNGTPDFVFPPVGRNLKKRMDEITRAVRWHRIAEPFGVKNDACIDPVELKDYWTMHAKESWVNHAEGEVLTVQAPARISRNMPLPEISNLHATDQPFVMASRYPNGAVAIVTLERTLDRQCILKPETVSIELTDLYVPIGIFGNYEQLIIKSDKSINPENIKAYGQDLAADSCMDITDSIKIEKNRIIIPGNVIRETGLSAASPGDISSPGMILRFFGKSSKTPAPSGLAIQSNDF